MHTFCADINKICLSHVIFMGFGQFYIVRFLFVGYMFILQKVRLNLKRLSNDIKKLDITWISCDSLPAGF